MNIKNLRNSAIALFCLGGVIAVAATKGDPGPFAKYGVLQIAGYDAGPGAPKCVSAAGQNTVMVRNLITDGGTSNNMFCGFDTTVTPWSGMPVLATETLTVDVVAVSSTTSVNPPNLDGGVSNTTSTPTPQLCCIQLPGTGPSDLHWMIVK